MASIKYSLHVQCSPEHLWTFLEEPQLQKQWMKGLVDNRQVGDGPAEVGSRFRMKIQEGRKVHEYDGQLTAREHPRHLGIRMWGGPWPPGMAIAVDYRLSGGGGRTRLDYDATFQADALPLRWRLLMPVGMLFGRLQLRGFLRTLKTLAEDGSREYEEGPDTRRASGPR